MIRRISGPGPGDVRDVDAPLVIGRRGGDLALTDEEASRRHTAVRPVPEGIEVEDLGSTNGTFLNGERVEGTVTVTGSAVLRIGRTELRLEVSEPEPQVTKISGAPPAGELPVPDVTVARSVQRPPPEMAESRPVTGAGDAGGGDADAGDGDEAPVAVKKDGPNPKVLAGAGALLVIVIAAVVVVLVAGGSSAKKSSTAIEAAAAKPRCAAHPPHLINDGFPEPHMVFSHAGVLDYTMKASPTTITALGHTWPAMGYNGQIPGPTLVVCPGDKLTLHLANGLPLDTNLHLHGLHVSPVGNGDNIFVDIHPFEAHTYQYQIPLDQPPGFFWYHPHFHPVVQPEVESGLAGGFVVEGELDDEFANIPERIMVIEGGREVLGPPIKLPGLKPPPTAGPPVFIVNGVHDPTVKIAPGQIQRWRLVNATSDRELRLSIPGVTFQLLAIDGNTLHQSTAQTQLLIGPGSRQEVLVKGPAAGTYNFEAARFQKCFKHCLDPFAGVPQQGAPDPAETLVTVQSTGTAVHQTMPTGALDYPKQLGDLRQANVDVYRTLDFTRVQNISAGRGTVTFPLNQRLFDPNRVDVTMRLNAVEQWTLVNPITASHNEWHTFHIHQNPFQVISINGHPLNYVLYEDNIDLAPGDRVVIRMKPVDFTGKFVFHCHLLFHEDNGMMGVVQVLANPTQAQLHTDLVMYMQPPDQRQLHQLIADVNSGRVTFGSSAWEVYELYCHPLGVTSV
ncbi:MAG: multicopper oxidase domain-containing protein [Solirubrobacterales bacterium]|nr:multicopper oxidase domain-containing protein [Solirubrobacterales bacterium]